MVIKKRRHLGAFPMGLLKAMQTKGGTTVQGKLFRRLY